MTKEIWINLPVKDVKKSKEFFQKLGWTFNTSRGESDDSACLLVGQKNIAVMLFKEEQLKSFMRHELADTTKVAEVLLSVSAESKEEVNEMAAKAKAAGGKLFAEPESIQGWMYGCGFCDLDGHRWNVLYMDPAGPKS